MKRQKEVSVIVLTLILGIAILGVVNAGFTGPSAAPPTGDGAVRVGSTGKVGVGGAPDTEQFKVYGTSEFTGQMDAGKINATTIDPIYTIGGNRYATYVASMIGQKEEVSGVFQINGQKEIDFSNQPMGSDLWLFAKITDLENNFDQMAVMLTPSFPGGVWYEKDLENLRLIIHANGSGGEVSYRFTAPRFDWGTLPTRLSNDDDYSGLVIE